MDGARLLLILGSALCVTNSASGYEVQTHKTLSKAAVAASMSLGGTGSVLDDLDIESSDTFPNIESRRQSVVGLIESGAVFEDDLQLRRALNHFFDPQNNGRALSIGGIEPGFPSPDWSLEDKGPLPPKFLIPEQLYSLRSAARYLVDALTSQAEGVRNKNMGLTFQSLGHVIHHVQDMAQPEHARNDQHLTGVDTSWYELFTNFRRQTLPSSGYPSPDLKMLRTARSFWLNQGKGMAEFTSHNFVSKDTNFLAPMGSFRVNPEYPLPAIAPDPAIEKTTLGALLGSSWEFFPSAQVWFLGAQVTDVNQPALSRFNPRASTYSIFSQDLVLTTLPIATLHAATTLNRFNFAAAHQFLIPRAVAYSAGLIDYFFRGRLALESVAVVNGTVSIKIRNVSAADFALRERDDGEVAEFSVYYDAQDGLRHRLALTNDDLSGEPMSVGASRTLSFALPDDLARDKPRPFMLVFAGVIGEEPGIAALALSAPSSGFIVHPSYLPQDGIAGSRLLVLEEGAWTAAPKSGLAAGNVDWKGSQKGDTLSWIGPPSRYFYAQSNRSGYSKAIYHQGRLLASAPANVQGASIRYTNGEKLLTAVTYESGQLRVYTRPFLWKYANDNMYHAQTNPNGWRRIYAANEQEPYTPTFFNGSGSEAQLITASGALITQRVRLRLAGDSVARTAVNAAGSGNLETRRTRRIVPERTLSAGIVQDDGAGRCTYLQECMQQEPCPGQLGGYLCVLSKKDFASSDTATIENRVTYLFDNPTVVCVDYDGDTEVLCEIAYRHGAGSIESAAENARFESLEQKSITCESLVPSYLTDQRESYSRQRKVLGTNTMRVLKVGSLELPLTGSSTEIEENFHHLRTLVDSTEAPGANEYSGTRQETRVDWMVQSRLLYIDARNATVVYETNDKKNTQVTDRDAGAAGWNAGPIHLTEATNRELIAQVGAQRFSLWQDADVRETNLFAGYSEPLNKVPQGRPECGAFPVDNSTESLAFFADSRDWSAIIHPRAHDFLQGYAADRDGRMAASQTIWVPQGENAYVAGGVWNFLTDGNLGQLLPFAGESDSYFPVGVID